MRNPSVRCCVQKAHGLTLGKYYVVREGTTAKHFRVENDFGNYVHYMKSRFEEIDMKTPPEYMRPAHCKCTPAACGCPAPVPTKALSGTAFKIVKDNINGLSDGLKAGRTTPHETRLILETCLFILKGE